MAKQKVVIYKDSSCPACQTYVPIIKQLARKNGVGVTEKDISKCKRKDSVCKSIKEVPAVVHNGREIPFDLLEFRLRDIGRKH